MQTGFDYVDLLLMTQGTGHNEPSPAWVNLENYDNCEGFEEDLLKTSNASCLDYLPVQFFKDHTNNLKETFKTKIHNHKKISSKKETVIS